MNYPKGHDFEFKMMRPSQLRTDPLYQRELDTARVEKIVREFDGDIFNEPKVSYRDGVYWIFDGQQSTAAWRKYHNGEDKPLQCKVYKGMTWLDECNAFMKQNGLAKDPTSNDKLRAAYNGKFPDVVDMVDKATLCGFVVDFRRNKTPTRIVCTATLYRAYKTLTPEDFLDMLTAIKEAWYGDEDAVSNQVLSGMTTFYRLYHGNFSRKDLVNSLKRITPTEIIRKGKAFTNRSNTYTVEIVRAYNKGRRNRLDEAEL